MMIGWLNLWSNIDIRVVLYDEKKIMTDMTLMSINNSFRRARVAMRSHLAKLSGIRGWSVSVHH